MADRRLIEVFERAYLEFHGEHRRERDPVSRAHRYSDPHDQEVVALIAAVLAYGNVTSILRSLDSILAPLGPNPADFLAGRKDPYGISPGFRHRFTTAEDIEILLHWIGSALRSHGSLEEFFIEAQPAPMVEALSGFITRFTSQSLPDRLRLVAERRRRNLKYLLSNPEDGSACKRLCLFLRWVARPADGIDLGLWSGVSTDRLILPIDTHLLKTLQYLGWTRATNATWKVAELATAQLRELNPADPLRYDFSLCHLSMSGGRLPFVPSLR